jgi:hypothetical protein
MDINTNTSAINEIPKTYISFRLMDSESFHLKFAMPTEGISYSVKNSLPEYAKIEMVKAIKEDVKTCFQLIVNNKKQIRADLKTIKNNLSKGLARVNNISDEEAGDSVDLIEFNSLETSFELINEILPQIDEMPIRDLGLNIKRIGGLLPPCSWWFIRANSHHGKPIPRFLEVLPIGMWLLIELL